MDEISPKVSSPKTRPATNSRRKRVSLSDIAAIAGVSTVAVAKALNGSGGKKVGVSKATAEKIRKIARKLDYRPNPIARQLRGLKSGIIGAIVDSNAPAVVSQLISHMESEARARNYRIMVGQSHGEIKQVEAYVADFADRGIDGVFCAAWDYSDAQRGEFIRRVFSRLDKVVFLGRPLIEEEAHHYVGSDRSDGIRLLVNYLHAKGRKKIGLLLFNSQSATITRRIDGFLDAMRQLGLSYGPEMVYRIDVPTPPEITPEHLLRYVNEFVKPNGVDAVIALNDRVAMMAINALQDLGLDVPGDVAVCGYDNVAMPDVYRPALTTIDQNTEQVAKAAVEMLVSLIEDREIPQEQRHIMVQPKLIVRDSA
ncbi:MAG: LacI family DNA-binding transcriptional regulator [Phycisphaerae bacterium]|nr:LacI family DNA-binding transcriptional regulator [Phycisphaerae bacterium]